MIEAKLSFRAQSLDNRSVDPVETDNQRRPQDDHIERRKFAEQISRVSLDGRLVFTNGIHAVHLLGDEFLIKLPSIERDVAGRVAPILCYGTLPDEPIDSWPDEVVESIAGFARRIERTISAESRQIARDGVRELVTARRSRSVCTVSGVIREKFSRIRSRIEECCPKQ